MVTNFMDIPDAQPDNEDKEEGVPVNRTSSVAYSNVGTFQTPDRGHSGSLSPNKFMKDVIMENTAEDDLTPDSGDINPSRNQRVRNESFKTHDFASIDSFVQLENQLVGRGPSFVEEAC